MDWLQKEKKKSQKRQNRMGEHAVGATIWTRQFTPRPRLSVTIVRN